MKSHVIVMLSTELALYRNIGIITKTNSSISFISSQSIQITDNMNISPPKPPYRFTTLVSDLAGTTWTVLEGKYIHAGSGL